MKQFTRALTLLTGLTLLAGCDTLGLIPLGVNHRPEVTVATVSGFVVDSVGLPLEGAMVSNGASVTFSDSSGGFTLTNVRTGIQYITATYSGVKSSPVEIEVKAGTNTISKIVVGTTGPVSDFQNPVKFMQIHPDTLTASYSISYETVKDASGDIVVPPNATRSYSATRYGSGKDVEISVASPPNGAGLVIASYSITYTATEAASISADFSPTIRVEPGTLSEFGPNKNLKIKNVGPASEEFSKALNESKTGVVEASIMLYTLDNQPVRMHIPDSNDRDKSIPFRAKVYIQRAEN